MQPLAKELQNSWFWHFVS